MRWERPLHRVVAPRHDTVVTKSRLGAVGGGREVLLSATPQPDGRTRFKPHQLARGDLASSADESSQKGNRHLRGVQVAVRLGEVRVGWLRRSDEEGRVLAVIRGEKTEPARRCAGGEGSTGSDSAERFRED